MTSREKIASADIDALTLVHYPDPRLREVSTPIDVFDDSLQRLVDRMAVVMAQAKGVGLAAPQVGLTVRLFIVAAGGDPRNVKAYVNPRIIAHSGSQQVEEGCLSLPGIFSKIKRSGSVTLEAQDITGKIFQETGGDLAARAFEHELDHLDGRLLVDRMGSIARMAHRRDLKQLEDDYAETK